MPSAALAPALALAVLCGNAAAVEVEPGQSYLALHDTSFVTFVPPDMPAAAVIAAAAPGTAAGDTDVSNRILSWSASVVSAQEGLGPVTGGNGEDEPKAVIGKEQQPLYDGGAGAFLSRVFGI